MGLGDHFPGRVFNASSKDVLCLASTSDGWVSMILPAGFASPVNLDVDGVRQVAGDPGLTFNSRITTEHTWWQIHGMFTEVMVNDKDGSVRVLTTNKPTNSDALVILDQVTLDGQGGVAQTTWPAGAQPVQIGGSADGEQDD